MTMDGFKCSVRLVIMLSKDYSNEKPGRQLFYGLHATSSLRLPDKSFRHKTMLMCACVKSFSKNANTIKTFFTLKRV